MKVLAYSLYSNGVEQRSSMVQVLFSQILRLYVRFTFLPAYFEPAKFTQSFFLRGKTQFLQPGDMLKLTGWTRQAQRYILTKYQFKLGGDRHVGVRLCQKWRWAPLRQLSPRCPYWFQTKTPTNSEDLKESINHVLFLSGITWPQESRDLLSYHVLCAWKYSRGNFTAVFGADPGF